MIRITNTITNRKVDVFLQLLGSLLNGKSRRMFLKKVAILQLLKCFQAGVKQVAREGSEHFEHCILKAFYIHFKTCSKMYSHDMFEIKEIIGCSARYFDMHACRCLLFMARE